MDPSDTIERFLGTGEWDRRFPEFEGTLAERRRRGTAKLREVLCRVVAWRADRSPVAAQTLPDHPEVLVRARLTPMVTGLFDPDDAAALLHALPDRVRVLTPASFRAAIELVPLGAGWDLANLLLDDLGVPTLADDVPELDGLCAGRRAWVLPRAFHPTDPWSDVVVHEGAHLLHLLTRREVGRSPPAGPILTVPVARRETFAYACEAWACHTRPGGPGLSTLDVGREDARVDLPRLRALLAEAEAGGGWRVLRRWAEGSG